MIEESYVSFEVAKLLKEKGFDEYCCQVYAQHPCHDEPIIMLTDATTNSKGVFGSVFYSYASAPTLQMAMKWLRDVHKLCVVVKPYITEEGIFYLFEIKKMNKDSVVNEKTKTGFTSYEQACEAAIKYCLENLI